MADISVAVRSLSPPGLGIYINPTPGRVDMKIEFQLADEDMISQLFFFVYDSKPTNVIGGDYQTGEEDVVKDCEIPQLAQEFVARVPKLKFSPAEIMSLLLANKRSPRRAIACVDTWVEKIGEERKKIARTNSWMLDGDDGF